MGGPNSTELHYGPRRRRRRAEQQLTVIDKWIQFIEKLNHIDTLELLLLLGWTTFHCDMSDLDPNVKGRCGRCVKGGCGKRKEHLSRNS